MGRTFATDDKRSHRVAGKIRQLKIKNPGMSNIEIARRVKCSDANVSTVLSRFLGKNTDQELAEFQQRKAEVYEAVQLRALGSVTDAKLRKASASSLITSVAILHDKVALLRGQATAINVNVLMDVAEAIRARKG